MKILILLIGVAVVTAHRNCDKPWQEFKEKYNKTYTSEESEEEHKQIFDNNYKKISYNNKLYNDGQVHYKLGVNEYADITTAEFVKTKCGTRPSLALKNKTDDHNCEHTTYGARRRRATLPDSVDWRSKGAVTGVKDQGQCGSCWSFSATGALEGQTFIKTGKLISLSEQNLIDCSSNYGNQGCNGGLMDNAFQYVKDNNGIDTESSYPYQMQAGTCHYDPNNKGATCTGLVDVPPNDESQLQQAVANIGPISVAIDASLDTFQFYKSGVYYDSRCSSSNLNHGVLVVGYGAENGTAFWLVKNSWGTGWGINGYVKMARNRNNTCGIASLASYPTV